MLLLKSICPCHGSSGFQLILGGFVQAVQFFCNPETRSTTLLDREAKRRRKTGQDPNIYGPNEFRGGHKISFKEVVTIFWRPFYMFFTEPIVLWLSLLSGLSDALIFTFLESFKPVYSQWGPGTVRIGFAFIPILNGYFISYASYMPSMINFRRKRARTQPWISGTRSSLGVATLSGSIRDSWPFGFAWTSLGPSYGISWIAPMIFSTLIAIANVSQQKSYDELSNYQRIVCNINHQLTTKPLHMALTPPQQPVATISPVISWLVSQPCTQRLCTKRFPVDLFSTHQLSSLVLLS